MSMLQQTKEMKKSAQRRRKHCALAVVIKGGAKKNFAPPQTPSWGRRTAKI